MKNHKDNEKVDHIIVEKKDFFLPILFGFIFNVVLISVSLGSGYIGYLLMPTNLFLIIFICASWIIAFLFNFKWYIEGTYNPITFREVEHIIKNDEEGE